MLVWDNRQSAVSAIGSVIACTVLGTVFVNREVPLHWFLSLLPAGALFYYGNMHRYIRRKRWGREPFPDLWRKILNDDVEFYRNLSGQEKERFEREIYLFLKENRITGIKMKVDSRIRVLVAASGVMLLFGHPDWEYQHLPEILIYPAPFDSEYNLHTPREERTLSGIVVPQNAIVISSVDLIRSFQNNDDGYHVGLHEFAHALDMMDGHAEGVPAYLQERTLGSWNNLMKHEMTRVRSGDSILDPYAAKGQEEMFAVAIEYFFQRPVELKQHHRELYEALSAFLNQDPARQAIS